MILFSGNDFLPHAPALDLREGALDLLLELYKEVAPVSGYLTNAGAVLWEGDTDQWGGLQPLLRRLAAGEFYHVFYVKDMTEYFTLMECYYFYYYLK